jgi:glycerol-3-phosphate acyltransferase PlsY
VGKALLAVGWLPGLELPGIGIDQGVDREWLAVVCAAAVVFGHVYPVWYEFRGGKGAATLIGAVAVLAPVALVPVLLVWLATVMLTGYVGLGTMLGTATLPLYFASVAPRSTPLVVLGLVMAAFIVFTHRSNVQRMREGIENRARRLWLLRPR